MDGEEDLNQSINISRIISKKRQLAEQIKLEDQEFTLEGLSELIEDLESEQSRAEPGQENKHVPTKQTGTQLTPVKELKEDSLSPVECAKS